MDSFISPPTLQSHCPVLHLTPTMEQKLPFKASLLSATLDTSALGELNVKSIGYLWLLLCAANNIPA